MPTVVSYGAQGGGAGNLLSSNHPFNDGNKRTAFDAMNFCLEFNGFVLGWNTREVGDLIIQVAQGLVDEALSLRPRERRILLEEAAEVRRYHERRQKAQKRHRHSQRFEKLMLRSMA